MLRTVKATKTVLAVAYTFCCQYHGQFFISYRYFFCQGFEQEIIMAYSDVHSPI